ncbi:MAG TPA: type II secretion system protein N [Burkholderiales bacterium]|nr:type II secretion system protein N [Burkholderiales bacterium]
MNRWLAIAIGLGIYAIALLVTAPATLLDGALARASHGRLRLAQAEGTLWSGTGQIEIRDASGRSGVAKTVAWRVMPQSAWRGRLVCEVTLDQPGKAFPVAVSLSTIEVSNADINVPATVLGLGVPKLGPLGLTGDVLIHIANLSFRRDAMNGTATLQWLAAGSSLTTVAPLGDYELKLDGEGITLHAYLRTLEGPLWLDGQGAWKQGTNPAFLANARISPEYQQQLSPLLRLIAVERGEGRFELQLN